MDDLQKDKLPIKIYMFEDDDFLAELYQDILRKAGYKVKRVVHPDENSLNDVIQFSPGVIITDISMPVMDGLTFTRLLKADAKTADIPVLVLSGNFEKASDAIDAGARSFLFKAECSSKKLLEAVANVC